MRGSREILTEDIIERCKMFESDSRREIFERLDMDITDLDFVLAERVYFSFIDDMEFEEPDLEDIFEVVASQYLGTLNEEIWKYLDNGN
jgi:hypothetical protein